MLNRPIHDFTSGQSPEKVGPPVVRVVRPRNHIGTAYGGDRIKLDESELNHPAVARAVMTEDEYQQMIEERDRRIHSGLQDAVSPAQRAADAQFTKALERRKQREEEERKKAPPASDAE